jgi:hypothetical protein
MDSSQRFHAAGVGWTLCVGLLVGCSSSQPPSEELVKINLRTIAQAYWAINDYHKRPPRDLDELRSTLADLHIVEMGGPPDVVLASPRDQQPFVIIIGAKPAAEESRVILAYEKQGADNSRYVLTTTGKVLQLSNEEFAKARFADKHKPSLNPQP